jgi:hypothetical protein
MAGKAANRAAEVTGLQPIQEKPHFLCFVIVR